ncbi:MAG: hypothetical protein QXO12_03240 [Candidatus Pacearchaeota archaeon]
MKKEEERLNLPKGESLLSPEEIGTYFMIENPNNIIAVVDIGQPRISSTARAIVAASGSGFDEVHFQPWKYIQRYAKSLSKLGHNPSVTISGEGEKKRLILLKETPGGPNDPKENFDPVGILIAKGVPPNQIRVMLGIREPFAQFASWYKFDNSRRPEIFLKGQQFIYSLLEKYRNQGILVVPFIFELFYPNPEDYLKFLYQQLGIANSVSLPQDLAFSKNPPVIWHEADTRLDLLSLEADVGSKYFERVVAPVLQQGKFQITQPRFSIPKNPDPNLIEAFENYREKAISFYQESVKRGLPRNKDFEVFITELNNY